MDWSTVEISKVQLWALLLHDVRYSLHRCSTAPGCCRDHLRSYAEYLPRHQIEQIREEVATEIERAEATGSTVGDPCDHATWKGVVWDLDRILEGGPKSGD